MSAARKHAEPVTKQKTPKKDIRVEMMVKNNVLWHAIFDQHPSLLAFCRAHPELENFYGPISQLLRFKISPFKKKRDAKQKVSYVSSEYRNVCLKLERILKVPAESLFPKHLYEAALSGGTKRVFEVSSFTALSSTAQREVRLLPAPSEHAPEIVVDQQLLRDKFEELFKTLNYREREILKLRFALEGNREHSLDEVALIFRVHRKRIQQIEAKAIRKLQQPSRAELLAQFLD